jgi:hypothetical protein
MPEGTVPYYRVRTHISQTAKGLHEVECTVEILRTVDIPEIDKLTDMALEILKQQEAKIKADGRKLVKDE